MLFSKFNSIYSQSNKDTIYVNDESMEVPLIYNAKDSLYIDVASNKVYLYGQAKVEYEGINMKAGFILIDLGKNEITASYRYTKDSTKVEFPEFTDGSESMIASRLRINTETKKVYIEEAKIKQTEASIYMEEGKRHSNEQIHFKNGRFSTCDLDEPHFHFQLSKAIMIPEKRIVTGPMNLWIKGVPTPLGLPFSMIPQQKEKRKSGLLFPSIIPMSAYGFGVQDLGYFSPINDSWQTTNKLTLYNRGTWGLKNSTEYKVNYKHNGAFDISYQFFKMGYLIHNNQNNIAIRWTHNTDPKSNPYWRFSSNVNFTSNNNSKTNLYQQDNTNYFNNQYNSDININRNFPGKPITMAMKISFRQNTQTKLMTLASPTYNLSVNRFFPFKKIISGTQEWKQVFSRIGVVYRLDFINQSTFNDSLLKKSQFNTIGKGFINGATHTMSVQTTAGFFKNTLKFSPSVEYRSNLNFQQISRGFVPNSLGSKDTLVTVLNQKTGISQNLSFNANLTTMLYSYYRFAGKNKPLLRHILTPTMGFSYIPKLNQTYSYLDTSGNKINYSPFERSAYSSYNITNSGIITFGVNNTFELKKASSKDSTGYKKYKLIEQLLISGNYNLFKDSMKLSDFSIVIRSNPFNAVSIVSNSRFTPYYWNENGISIAKFAYDTIKKLGRFNHYDISTTYTFASKNSLEKLNTTSNNQQATNWNSDYMYFSLHPEQLLDFQIPWKVNLTHIYSVDITNTISRKHTLMLNGDISFTKRWKISGTTNLDLQTAKIVNTRLELTRDMHCWGLSFMWVPTGLNKYFQFRIFATGSMLNSLQHTFTKPPLFF